MVFIYFFPLFISYSCLAQENLKNVHQSLLNQINNLTNEIEFLTTENFNKGIRIQILEGKVKEFEQESQNQTNRIEKLTEKIEILQNQINKTKTDFLG